VGKELQIIVFDMKRLISVALAAFMAAFIARAGEPVWHDASEFPVYGKITDATNARYERLTASLKDVARTPVWNLGRNSAGLYIRFTSNSLAIHLRWVPLTNNTMSHMTDTGTKGLDLYGLTEDGWRFVRSARPKEGLKKGEVQTAKLVCGKVEREYMLYLPLYDGLASLEIGVEEGAFIKAPSVETPSNDKPVIMYGSSILQGGCCSRPGMAHTNILSRRLDRTVINLGFSGNALIDYEIAEYMASYPDPGVYVLDYVPNATKDQIDERAVKFFRILRDAHPDVPVVFVEVPYFPTRAFDKGADRVWSGKNEAQKRVFDTLKKAGEKNIFYIVSEGMIGDDGEATVDGLHFTDLGMMRYVDHVYPTIKKALSKNK
jgi:lysophospholipase L1-like esterase